MAQIYFPWQYIADTTKGRPVALGSMYFGQPDLDPEIPANQIQVRVKQEDGTLLNVSQPILLNAGGVPTYSGSPVILDIVEEEFSWKVLDQLGGQVYYNENNIPIQFGTNQIQDGAVTTPKLADGAVTTPKIADEAVVFSKMQQIANNTVVGNNSGGLSVPQAIQVQTGMIANLAVTTAKIDDLAVTEAKLDANSVSIDKMQNNSVDQAEIVSGAIHQSELSTAVATNNFTVNTGTAIGAISVDRQVMSGGQYAFQPRTETTNDTGNSEQAFFCYGAIFNGTYALNNYIAMVSVGDGGGAAAYNGEARSRYIDASAPWNMGHGDIGLFVFLRVNASKKVTGVSIASAPVWGYNGKTSIVPDRVSKILNEKGEKICVRKYKKVISPDSKVILPPWRGGNPSLWNQAAAEAYASAPIVEVEIDHAMKNADMNDIPHPFLDLSPDESVVLVDPTSSFIDNLADLYKVEESLGRLFLDGYIILDNEISGYTSPRGVKIYSVRWA